MVTIPALDRLTEWGTGHEPDRGFPSPRGRVALLGFAHRCISVKFTVKTPNDSRRNPLPASVKTVADWIRVMRDKNGLARYQLGQKMGIASSVLASWEARNVRPPAKQMRTLVTLLGRYSPVAAPRRHSDALETP